MIVRKLTLAAVLAVAGTGMAFAQSTTLDGVYTEEQATAGQAVYEANCAACHAATLRGTPGGPGIVGVRFELNWADHTVGELYSYIHANMPAGQPGTLSDQQYAEVTAYILQQNEYPSGDTELSTDAEELEGITIVKAD